MLRKVSKARDLDVLRAVTQHTLLRCFNFWLRILANTVLQTQHEDFVLCYLCNLCHSHPWPKTEYIFEIIFSAKIN